MREENVTYCTALGGFIGLESEPPKVASRRYPPPPPALPKIASLLRVAPPAKATHTEASPRLSLNDRGKLGGGLGSAGGAGGSISLTCWRCYMQLLMLLAEGERRAGKRTPGSSEGEAAAHVTAGSGNSPLQLGLLCGSFPLPSKAESVCKQEGETAAGVGVGGLFPTPAAEEAGWESSRSPGHPKPCAAEAPFPSLPRLSL